MKGSRKWRNSVYDWFSPRHGVDIQNVQVAQSASAHTAINDQFGAVPISVICDRSVRFTRRGWLAVSGRQIPILLLPIGGYVESVEVVQIARDVILRILTIVGKTAEQEDTIAVKCKTVSETRARWWTVVRTSGFQSTPFPSTGLQFVEFVGVLSILNHTTKHQNSRPIHYKTVRRTSRRNVAFYWRYKPLIGGCGYEQNKKQRKL